IAPFADDPTLGPITLGEVEKLVFRNTYNPYVPARRRDDALHQAELAVEGNAFRRCQWLAVLVKDSHRFAAIGGQRELVVGIDGRAKGPALHSAAGKACGDRRKRATVRSELGCIPLPKCILRLPSHREVVADPQVALAVEHRLAARTVAAA